MLDRQLVSDLETFAVDPRIMRKLDEHDVLDDLDILKLIQQLYTVGWKAHQSKVEFNNPFGKEDRPRKGRVDKVLETALKDRV